MSTSILLRNTKNFVISNLSSSKSDKRHIYTRNISKLAPPPPPGEGETHTGRAVAPAILRGRPSPGCPNRRSGRCAVCSGRLSVFLLGCFISLLSPSAAHGTALCQNRVTDFNISRPCIPEKTNARFVDIPPRPPPFLLPVASVFRLAVPPSGTNRTAIRPYSWREHHLFTLRLLSDRTANR